MKKKAIKLATATAIAASAFVAVAPTQSEAATNSVDKAITKATNQMAKSYDTYHKAAKNEGKLPATGTIRNQVKLANDYYDAATKEIAKNGGSKTKKAAYTKKLNDKKYFLDRAEAYLAAVNTNLNPAKTAFNEAVKGGKQKTVLAAQKAYNEAIEGFEAKVDKIYGPDARNLLKAKYAAPAHKLADSVNDEMKVYNAYKDIEQKDLIEKDIAAANETIQGVKDLADKIAKLDTALAKNITKAVVKNNEAFEKAVKDAVAIEGITDGEKTEEETKTITVKATKGSEIKVTLNGKAVAANENGTYTLKLQDGSNKVAVESTVYGVKTELNKEITSNQTPVVKSVSAINASQVEVTFNKAVDASTIFDASGELISGVVTVKSLDTVAPGTLTGELSEDGKTLTLTSSTKLDKRYDVIIDKVKSADKKDIEKSTTTINVTDTIRPTFAGVSYLPNGNATFTFSEPIDASDADIASALNVTGPTNVSIAAGDITLSTTKKSFTVALPATMTKDQNYTFTFTGLKDFAGNLLTPNPVSATVVKKDSDTVKPTVTSVASAGIGKVSVTFSEKVDATNATLKVGGTAATALTTSTDAGKTVVTFNSTDLTTGVKSLEIGGVKDLAGNTMVDVTKVVEITADNTAPVFVSQNIKTVGSDQILVVNYNEEVTVDNTKDVIGSYVDSDSITHSVTIDKANIALGSDKKSVEIKLPTTTGNYTLTLPTVKDTATNTAASKTVTFKLGTAVDTTKPKVSTVVQTNNKVVVTFDREVSSASALNNANYELEGVSSAFVGTPIFKGNAKTVELTLKEDAITTNGDRNFTVKNVATGAGAIMETEVKARAFKETVRPTAVSAKVTGSKTIEITFSEAIQDGSTTGNDINVYQGSSTTALSEVSEVITGNKLVITLTNELTSLSGITVKASDVADLKDLNNNIHNVTGTINVQ